MSTTAATPSVPQAPGDSKDKMSRALGAAFLGHQVAQLENRINNSPTPPNYSPRGGRGRGSRGGGRVWNPDRGGQRVRKRSFTLHPVAAEPGSEQDPPVAAIPIPIPPAVKEKSTMANVIVLDASVLVYALGQAKRWCKEERKETLIVPLEVLNTLDLLKKGTSPLAIHARAASRFLEAQVGANPRIHVQRDEDFCPWDEIYSTAKAANASSPAAAISDDNTLPPEDCAPEWMRQTICCTIWEVNKPSPPPVTSKSGVIRQQPRRVALAVVKPLLNPPIEGVASSSPGDASQNGSNDTSQVARHAVRATGDLIRIWAPLFGIKVLNIDQGAAEHSHSTSNPRNGAEGGKSLFGGNSGRRGGGDRSGAESYGHRKSRSSEDGSGPRGLVEKVRNGLNGNSIVVASGTAAEAPPGVNKIRLLTRGEKLEP